MRLALKVAYDGTRFQGSQRNPTLRTVEGDLVDALVAIEAAPDAEATAMKAAGRTDAGVSAAGNVFAADVAFRPEQIVRALNSELRDAWALAYAPVPDGWNPRHAFAQRTYVYHAAVGPEADEGKATTALACFLGEHDFTSFSRAQAGRSPVRRVDVARVHGRGGVWQFTIEGPSFLWNQVRRMVAASLQVAHGRASVADVERGLAGERVDLGCAPPEGLTLLDVRHKDVAWTTEKGDVAELTGWFRARVGEARVAERRERLRLQAAEQLGD